MRYYSLLLLIGVVVAFCIWQQTKDPEVSPAVMALKKKKENTGIKWNDSLMKQLPKGMDTSIIVKDLNGTPLKFAQYIKPVFNHKAIIYQDRGEWRLHRLTETSQDSLKKDDYAVASSERWDAYRNPDTITDWRVKLNAIAHTLAQADYVLVLKGQRKMLIKRKGRLIKTFNINMGWAPVGHKEREGDGKTPEGLYHLDSKYDRSDKFYKSYSISYPSIKERAAAKRKGINPGFGVSIHGTKPGKTKAKDWTAGCIALQNKDMDTLFAYIADGTLIEIRK
ncbi:murein L,D-transpeptidase family protein [Pedobacter sp. Hv1]|uniref:L,D-transpeptidase family protein n=1 Tax=Pedobacter sp. Hv1 TaxID=1740090 RepID=UPI0006D88F9E|nr:L,D-transpeptidase family protein [Pedobacter sp. Hv1]KQB99996.1 hypothetical protein AQF98_15945 [Pedobacter sp. Hv1]